MIDRPVWRFTKASQKSSSPHVACGLDGAAVGLHQNDFCEALARHLIRLTYNVQNEIIVSCQPNSASIVINEQSVLQQVNMCVSFKALNGKRIDG